MAVREAADGFGEFRRGNHLGVEGVARRFFGGFQLVGGRHDVGDSGLDEGSTRGSSQASRARFDALADSTTAATSSASEVDCGLLQPRRVAAESACCPADSKVSARASSQSASSVACRLDCDATSMPGGSSSASACSLMGRCALSSERRSLQPGPAWDVASDWACNTCSRRVKNASSASATTHTVASSASLAPPGVSHCSKGRWAMPASATTSQVWRASSRFSGSLSPARWLRPVRLWCVRSSSFAVSSNSWASSAERASVSPAGSRPGGVIVDRDRSASPRSVVSRADSSCQRSPAAARAAARTR